LVTRAEFSDSRSISTHVYKLANYFNKKGHEIFIISTNWSKSNMKNGEEYEECDGIKIFSYSLIQKPLLLKIFLNLLVSESAIKKLDKKYNFDIVHSHEGGQSLTHDIITAHACHRGWIKLANEMNKKNDPILRYWFYKIGRELLPTNRLVLEVEKYNYKNKHYKKIIAVSTNLKKQIMDCYNVPSEDIVVIPNGVDCNKFKPNSEIREKIRRKHKINEEEVVINFSGTDFNKKGLKYFINSLKLIKAKNFKVFVIGKDNPKPYKDLASRLGVLHKIVFAGFVPDISEYYAASDIFVFPTLYEPFGLVITEAMASGLPVITSKIAGAAEIMEDGKDGLFLKDPTNPEEITEKINILVEDENLRKQMSKNARKTAEKYSWDKVAKKTLDVYEEISRA